jgi:hypothetical protein
VDAARVLAGSEPHLMIADPHYGVSYESSWRARRNLSNGKLAQGKVLNDDRADWREAYVLFPGDVAYVWHGALHGDVVAADLAACGLQLCAQIIYAKQHFTLSRGDYHWRHETCWYAVREGKRSHWAGDRKQTTVWEIANNNPFGNRQREQTWGHGTQKLVELMRRPIANNSRPGQAIYDAFLGLGTSLIAAEMTGACAVVSSSIPRQRPTASSSCMSSVSEVEGEKIGYEAMIEITVQTPGQLGDISIRGGGASGHGRYGLPNPYDQHQSLHPRTEEIDAWKQKLNDYYVESDLTQYRHVTAKTILELGQILCT